ncbi:MAG: methyltransferase domain-containing protein [Acidobacteriota bacterium]
MSDLSWSYLRTYFTARRSLFRHYQDLFLTRHGGALTGEVVELGAERQYAHGRFFPNCRSFRVTNVEGDVDEIRDVTDMAQVADASEDAYVCVSVLEHVHDVQAAAAEISRTLKPGGTLLLTVPFAVPYHDVVDYWRFSRDAYARLFPELDIRGMTRFGGVFSSIANTLQRPRGRLGLRYGVYKTLGFVIALLGRRLDTADGFPLGYGIVAVKRGGGADPGQAP